MKAVARLLINATAYYSIVKQGNKENSTELILTISEC